MPNTQVKLASACLCNNFSLLTPYTHLTFSLIQPMKKLLLSFIAASVFVTGCTTSDSNTTASTDDTTNTAIASELNSTAANSGSVNITLVSPQGTVPMGDTELIVEVKDSTGQPVVTNNLMVDVSMPMEGEEAMLTETEVLPGSEPGLYQINTYLSMEGTWIVKTAVIEGQQQGQADFTIEAK